MYVGCDACGVSLWCGSDEIVMCVIVMLVMHVLVVMLMVWI